MATSATAGIHHSLLPPDVRLHYGIVARRRRTPAQRVSRYIILFTRPQACLLIYASFRLRGAKREPDDLLLPADKARFFAQDILYQRRLPP